METRNKNPKALTSDEMEMIKQKLDERDQQLRTEAAALRLQQEEFEHARGMSSNQIIRECNEAFSAMKNELMPEFSNMRREFETIKNNRPLSLEIPSGQLFSEPLS